jgi:sigma-B regulation protein RsbU (phosphoserine phosphatase)
MATNNGKSKKSGKKFSETVWEDLHRGDLKRTFKKDFKDIYQFYFDDETRARLSKMNKFKRVFVIMFLLLKNMILKLTPARRVLLLIGIIFSIGRSDSNNGFIGMAILLLILILELKDKLLAQDELAVGRAVQFALMPEKNPKFPGWEVWLFTRPANDVGGDLVDYLKISESRLYVALADVSGKGLGAALFMSKLQSTIRALAQDFDSLELFGKRINEIFCRDALPNRFASLVYVELTDNSGKVRLLNAGHFPPVIIHGETITELPQGSSALGLSVDSEYTEQTAELNVNDLLVIYSDGLTEACNEEGEFFGDQMLFELLKRIGGLTAEKAGKKLLQENKIFVGEAPQNDDLSLAIIKRVL